MYFFLGAFQPDSGSWPPLTHSDTPHSVRFLWTSDQPDAETCTWQHTIIIKDRYPCHRRYSKPQSQQASGHFVLYIYYDVTTLPQPESFRCSFSFIFSRPYLCVQFTSLHVRYIHAHFALRNRPIHCSEDTYNECPHYVIFCSLFSLLPYQVQTFYSASCFQTLSVWTSLIPILTAGMLIVPCTKRIRF